MRPPINHVRSKLHVHRVTCDYRLPLKKRVFTHLLSHNLIIMFPLLEKVYKLWFYGPEWILDAGQWLYWVSHLLLCLVLFVLSVNAPLLLKSTIKGENNQKKKFVFILFIYLFCFFFISVIDSQLDSYHSGVHQVVGWFPILSVSSRYCIHLRNLGDQQRELYFK